MSRDEKSCMPHCSLTALTVPPPSLFLSLIGVNIMVFMAALDMSSVNMALPSLAKQLDTDFATIQWVILSSGCRCLDH